MKTKNLPLILAVAMIMWVGIVIILAIVSQKIIHRFGPLPEQPVEFSHTVHVNQLGLECLYCHSSAEKSIHATIPSSSLCLDCHEGVDMDIPEVKKMLAIIEEKGEIDWERVYEVKDHVYFSHRVHTVIAKIECQECHGPVEHMTVAIRASGGSSDRGFMEMGWCVTCHERRGAPRECITCHK
ncbi:hypothetical protein GF337_16990 [candidate division KSB1 bacterium]|nr:hypothetical protein [candidate division KSB1 bacterium]